MEELLAVGTFEIDVRPALPLPDMKRRNLPGDFLPDLVTAFRSGRPYKGKKIWGSYTEGGFKGADSSGEYPEGGPPPACMDGGTCPRVRIMKQNGDAICNGDAQEETTLAADNPVGLRKLPRAFNALDRLPMHLTGNYKTIRGYPQGPKKDPAVGGNAQCIIPHPVRQVHPERRNAYPPLTRTHGRGHPGGEYRGTDDTHDTPPPDVAAAGIQIVTVVPIPSVLSSPTRPPRSSTVFRTIASPSPIPSVFVEKFG
jgi:hypothetical protein